ncbi:MAG: ATP-binding cassette domain-containing protein [Hyphomicrobiales bacterium]|nr:ATP-binding cassette domain-containing protein [Hyphomicrobiales bacterium]
MLEQDYCGSDTLSSVAPVVEVNNLCKKSGCDSLIRNLSFQISRGEIVGVVGQPGVRPDIMLDLLSGVVPPTSGRIVIHGKDVTHFRRECRFRCGIAQLLPTIALVPHFTVIENILLYGVTRVRPLFPRQGGLTDEEKALSLLKCAGLAERAKDHTEELDTHSKWLLTIAIAMASRPSLLLLTESSVGATAPPATFDVLRRIARQGTSLLIISRSWHPIMEACNRIEVLREGKVLATSAETDDIPVREIVGLVAMRHMVKFDHRIFKFRRLLKRGWLQGRTLRRSERAYNPTSDC